MTQRTIAKLLIGSRFFNINTSEYADYDYFEVAHPSRDNIMRQLLGMQNDLLRGEQIKEEIVDEDDSVCWSDTARFTSFKLLANLYKGSFYAAVAINGKPVVENYVDWAWLKSVAQKQVRTQATLRSAFGMIESDLKKDTPKDVSRAWITANAAAHILQWGELRWDNHLATDAKIIRGGHAHAIKVAKSEIAQIISYLESRVADLPQHGDMDAIHDYVRGVIQEMWYDWENEDEEDGKV